jgi:hypothetical protein
MPEDVMNRWLMKSAIALAIAPISAISASPTTRPDATSRPPTTREFDRLYKIEPWKGLPEWKGWPDYSKSLVPSVVAPRFDVKPHGRSFQFNGVTVYIEPV